MPDSIKLQFKLVASPEAKSSAQNALLLEQLRIALLGCHQTTVKGAVRGFVSRFPCEVNFHKAAYGPGDKYYCTIYIVKERQDGRTYHEKVMVSGDVFTKETKDNREYFCQWLQEQVQFLKEKAHDASRSVYWFRLERQIHDALISNSDEELTAVEFRARKEQLATYLEALANAVRRLTPEPGKYQALPSPDEPSEWGQYIFVDPRAVDHPSKQA